MDIQHLAKDVHLSIGGNGVASKTDKFLDDNFLNPVNPNNGFALNDHRDIKACRMLEFLLPILYLEILHKSP